MPASEPSLADWDQWELKEKQPVFSKETDMWSNSYFDLGVRHIQ